MSDRRQDSRPESHDRRTFPRPPLWLNLLLLVIAVATFAYARHQRTEIHEKTALLFKPTPASPAEWNSIREQLAQMDLTEAQMAKELDGRMKFLSSVQGEQFYITIDSARKKMVFRLGKDVVREADVQIGEARTLTSVDKKKTWTFVPLKGGFSVIGKQQDYDWTVPDWIYAMKAQPAPAEHPAVHNGVGKYVIQLQDNYIIHTPPPAGSPLQGPKPGSYMIPEADLAAIWPRVTGETRVYIF